LGSGTGPAGGLVIRVPHRITLNLKGVKVMVKRMSMILPALLALALLAGACGGDDNPNQSGLPNPASVYCEEQGGTSVTRTAADGSQSGVCVFPNGSEYDEWALYRGEVSVGG
jgi:putative hemolysin